MKSLLHELHRRSLWQVLGLYLAGSWVALQVVETLTESAGLPEWVPAMALVLLVIGFPIVIGTAFIQEGVRTRVPEAPPRSLAGVGEVPPPPVPSTMQGLFTWRRAVLGGVGALLLLLLGVGGWIAMRSLGVGPAATLVAQGVLDEQDRILLADFNNRTPDSLLAGVVTEALRVDLAQSKAVRLAEQGVVSGALSRMELSADTPLDETLARLIAQREGIKAVLSGDVGSAGSGFVLTAELVEPANGEILFTHREDARGPDEIIDAINRLSRRLRERVGESLGSIRAAPPLERVTTSNLEALRLYTQAVRAIEIEGDNERGLALLDEAVALDTAFAAAYRKIGVTLGNQFEQRDRLVTAIGKAYQHRDRLTQSERYMTTAAYHTQLTGDTRQAVAAYEALLETDPTYYPALNNLGILYYGLRDPARAEELYLQAAKADRSSPFPWLNAVWPQVDRGGFDAARATLDSLDAVFPGYPAVPSHRAQLAVVEGDYEAANDYLSSQLETRAGDLFRRAEAHRLLGSIAATRGRMGLAERHLRDSRSANESRGVPSASLDDALSFAWVDLVAREDTAAARRRIAAALAATPLDGLPAPDRPYLNLADLHAWMGETDRARGLLAEYETAIPPDLRGSGGENDLLRTRAVLVAAESRTEEALELIRESDTGGCRACAMPYYAHVFERAGMADSAIAARERYVELTWLDRIYFDEAVLAANLERLGELYDARGDTESAARYYAEFVELWAEADEELQPRVRAAQARLEEILRQRG